MSNQLDPSPFQPLDLVDSPGVAELIIQLQQGVRDFRGRDFANLDLSGLDLSHTDLRGANFFGAELRCVNFTGADLREANFKGANLRLANLSQSDLSKAHLVDTDLCHASLQEANLTEAKIIRIKCFKTFFHNTLLPDGTLTPFKMRFAGQALSSEDLLTQYQQGFRQRKKLALFLVLGIFYLGLQLLTSISSFLLLRM